MTKETYHHGDLKECLIINGLKLLNEKGIEEFSIRKVAAMCNVSHTAPYKHFKNKEELVIAISNYVISEFEDSLQEIVKLYQDDPHKQIIELGKRYVTFMVDNPDYLRFLFLGKSEEGIEIINNNFIESRVGSFEIFKKSSVGFFNNIGVLEEGWTKNITAMWAMVHGLAVLLSNGTLKYDGEVSELVETILLQKLKF